MTEEDAGLGEKYAPEPNFFTNSERAGAIRTTEICWTRNGLLCVNSNDAQRGTS
jgi:hypothetical protein